MRRAGQAALDELAELLSALRRTAGIREKSRGVFYRGARAFLHFHEDPDGLFADVRFTTTFERRRVSSAREQLAFLWQVKASLSRPTINGKPRP